MEKISFLFSLLLVVAFGFVNGSPPKEAVGIYELKKGDMSVKFTNWGATIISVVLPDKNGKLGDIALGYESVKDYMNDTTYFGALVGRVANRIGGAKFSLYGTEYKLVANEGKNMLHGGPKGFGDVVWKVKKYEKDGHAPFIVFGYLWYIRGDFSAILDGLKVGLVISALMRDVRDKKVIDLIKLALVSPVITSPVDGGEKKKNKKRKYQKTKKVFFGYDSYDGEEGFPGELKVTVGYTLLPKNQLSVTMKAKAVKKSTPVNLAQHTYWNLGNHDSGDILSEEIQLFASRYTPVDSQLIPTGKLLPLKGTPYDFLKPNTIGSRIKELPKGYDINYALDGTPGKLKKVAVVKDKKSGRVMELFANQPGVQFYTGNMIKNVKGKGGFVYKAHAALCLETQGFPDSVNNPYFPSQIVTPEKPYKHNMLFKFSIAP